MSFQKQMLEKTFKQRDVLSMAFGAMIGWGWIMLSGQWAESAGMLGAVLAYAVGAIMCVFVGLIYAELTPALPYTGGSVVFAYKSMGYWPAVFAGLSSALAYLGVTSWEGPAFAMAVNYIIPIPQIGYLWTVQDTDVYVSVCLVSVLASAIITYVNYCGAKSTAMFQKAATIGLIMVGTIFFVGGVSFGDFDYARPLLTDFSGFTAVLLVVPAMFVGFDVIPQTAGEMDLPLHKIPGILITSICIVGAICGIVTSWNGFFVWCGQSFVCPCKRRYASGFSGENPS